MDDNIINVNILNLFDSKKIIYYKPTNANSKDIICDYGGGVHKLDYIDNHSGWH